MPGARVVMPLELLLGWCQEVCNTHVISQLLLCWASHQTWHSLFLFRLQALRTCRQGQEGHGLSVDWEPRAGARVCTWVAGLVFQGHRGH